MARLGSSHDRARLQATTIGRAVCGPGVQWLVYCRLNFRFHWHPHTFHPDSPRSGFKVYRSGGRNYRTTPPLTSVVRVVSERLSDLRAPLLKPLTPCYSTVSTRRVRVLSTTKGCVVMRDARSISMFGLASVVLLRSYSIHMSGISAIKNRCAGCTGRQAVWRDDSRGSFNSETAAGRVSSNRMRLRGSCSTTP